MVLTVHEPIDQAHDGHQHHAEEQGIDPAVVPVAGCGLGRHGLPGLKEKMQGDGGRRRPEEKLAQFALNTGSLPAGLLPCNTTSVTQGTVTWRNNPHPGSTQRSITTEGNGTHLYLAPRQRMMQNTIRFRVGAIADLWVVCNWEGFDCFSGKPGLAEPLSKRAAVRRFSTLAFWQESIRQRGNTGLLVRPIPCAGPAEGSPAGYSGCGGGNWCAF
jgi:hypothetical protein